MKKIITAAIALLFTATSLLASSRDYSSLQNMLIKFYQYQRAGLKTGSANNANSGFTDASHNGDNYNGKPLDGGWYDAGDYVKFGMNLSYAVYCLLKGYDVFPGGYVTSSGSVPDILVQAKFATDYLCKAVIDANTVVLDVGSASSDHAVWAKANNSAGRSGGDIKLCDGGDIPATYAACLAVMSVLYRKYDAAYADECLAKAKIAFTFAKTKFNSGKNYCTAQQDHGAALYDYPTVDGTKLLQITDRMIAAGVELYRATLGSTGADPLYKAWAQKSMTEFYNCAGYAYIGPFAAFEVWRQGLGSATSLAANIRFINGRLQTTGAFSKVFQNTDWGTARDIGTVAFEYALAYITNSDEATRTTYLQHATDHVDWVAGYIGARSYICGVNSGPTKIHYRTTNYGAIPGAVVTGPDDQGGWSNDGSANYCEVAVDYNAGIIGAIAFLKAVKDNSALRLSKEFTASKLVGVDLTAGSVTLSAELSKATPWTITITGNFGTKELKGTGTAISAAWDGSADKGFFMAGEIVKAKLSVEGDISALDLVKSTPISIELAKTKKLAAKPGDKLVDDFEKKDTINKFGGKWEAFGTGVGLLATTYSFTTQDASTAITLNGNVKTFEPTTFSGLKTYFRANNSAGAVGLKSIFFDLKASAPTNVRVELEQSDITDGTYYGVTIPVSNLTNSYRIEVANFTQADWATVEKPIDFTKMVSLRFTIYDSTGIIKVHLDNLAIEDLTLEATSTRMSHAIRTANNPVFTNNTLLYANPILGMASLRLSIFDLGGRMVQEQAIKMPGGASAVTIGNLPAGMYTAVYSTSSGKRIDGLRFFVAK